MFRKTGSPRKGLLSYIPKASSASGSDSGSRQSGGSSPYNYSGGDLGRRPAGLPLAGTCSKTHTGVLQHAAPAAGSGILGGVQGVYIGQQLDVPPNGLATPMPVDSASLVAHRQSPSLSSLGPFRSGLLHDSSHGRGFR